MRTEKREKKLKLKMMETFSKIKKQKAEN